VPPVTRQIPTIIIPTVGAGTETIADTAQHASQALPVWPLQEKQASVIAIMAGAPGPLNCWVEISSSGLPGTWVLPGAIATLVASGGLPLAWTVHSSYARVVMQAPAWAAGSWTVVVTFEAKTP